MKTPENTGLVVDSGFDYLTLTAKPTQPHYEEFNCCALDFIASMQGAGIEVIEKRNAGYEGWQSGETFFGKREDGTIWRTSGATSRNVAGFVRFNGITPNVTRCDLQRTIEQHGHGSAELDRIFNALRGRLAVGSPSKPQKFSAFYDKNGSVGGTFGARSSTQYLRCYRADIRHPEKFARPSLRYEVEYKSERANQVWAAFEQCEDDVTLSASLVGCAFAAKGMNQAVCAENAPCPLPPIGRKGSDEKTVYWIQNTVCKIIARLVKAGYLDDLAPHLIAALCPVPDVRTISTSLEAEIQTIDWELIENGTNHKN